MSIPDGTVLTQRSVSFKRADQHTLRKGFFVTPADLSKIKITVGFPKDSPMAGGPDSKEALVKVTEGFPKDSPMAGTGAHDKAVVIHKGFPKK